MSAKAVDGASAHSYSLRVEAAPSRVSPFASGGEAGRCGEARMTKIEWTGKGGQTWNPWWGCGEIGPECGQYAPTGKTGCCYAAIFAGRGLPRDANGQPLHPG